MDGSVASAGFDVARVRKDFPILSTTHRGKPLVFLDSGASAQKPRAVIEAMKEMMETAYANVHRGAYHLSEQATEAYEAARRAAARFLNAADEREIVLTGTGSTQAINLVAHSFGRGVLKPGQAVLVSEMEHHANLVPWQMLRDAHGVELRICRVTDAGELDMADLEAKLADGKVGLVSIAHMSNVLGTVVPARRIVDLAHAHGARVMFDGSQGAVHRKVDVQALGCDFYVFTAHKLYGPTGLGILYGRMEVLEQMPPFLGGGDMITEVTLERSLFAGPPLRFEAGTPPIIEAIGLHAAIDYVEAIGMEAIEAHERSLVDHAMKRLGNIDGVTLLGRAQDRGGVFAFSLDNAHSHDLATLLDRAGICVRSGRHCAEPLHARFGVESTCRASFGLYTTHEEVDYLAEAVTKAREFFA
ncbi:Cysteine desulfurase [Roseomonas mucosa]|uniref:Cysteine desulfurase n=1 Tax=Roseomonas mucosa TaxID=207340 RepID=A0A1S8D0X6_9PROT|nr:MULTISPECIES: SufS family cysteine desulfurase [Roseomonas]MBS5905204.1 SufS family cysteine desulfurase [Acetobacteraceae bacterium]ATR20732.1 SufS family cysteine desulfurase [Roseomonas sp. FDAARGOS_362]MCG7354091.1 SufS family cysteine desulfurase [Roseomonas mucosa]MCG7359177.1 SufS family cysteine desulfurase [Roseomonas mucosa]MDT8290647.1 SufS family cysteine desulfurase [Roseomonas mucosa]